MFLSLLSIMNPLKCGVFPSSVKIYIKGNINNKRNLAREEKNVITFTPRSRPQFILLFASFFVMEKFNHIEKNTRHRIMNRHNPSFIFNNPQHMANPISLSPSTPLLEFFLKANPRQPIFYFV